MATFVPLRYPSYELILFLPTFTDIILNPLEVLVDMIPGKLDLTSRPLLIIPNLPLGAKSIQGGERYPEDIRCLFSWIECHFPYISFSWSRRAILSPHNKCRFRGQILPIRRRKMHQYSKAAPYQKVGGCLVQFLIRPWKRLTGRMLSSHRIAPSGVRSAAATHGWFSLLRPLNNRKARQIMGWSS